MTMGKKWIIHGFASRTVRVNGKILRDDGQEMKQSDEYCQHFKYKFYQWIIHITFISWQV